jgi:hypothetical protein
MRSFRWPLLTLALGVVLLTVAVWLDGGGQQSRDLALLVGATALNVVLPVGVLWLIVVALVRLTSNWRKGRSG